MNQSSVVAIAWKEYKPTTIFFLISIAITLTLLFYFATTNRKAEDLKMSFESGHSYYLELLQNESTLLASLRKFIAFQNRNIVGEPNRLQWMETLGQIVQELKIPSMNFNMEETRQLSDGSHVFWHDELEVNVTEVGLKFLLLHEGQYYHFFKELEERAAGRYTIDECELTRRLASSDTNSPVVSGSCRLFWFTISDVTKQWEAPSS